MNKQGIIKVAQWMIENCIVIDTETTGLTEHDTIVEIAAVNPKTRETLLNTLVEPLSPMSAGAFKTHNIDAIHAAFLGLSPQIMLNKTGDALRLYSDDDLAEDRKYMAAFNRAFDARLLIQTAYKLSDIHSHIRSLHIAKNADGTTCIMELANRYFHHALEWDYEQAKFKRLSLTKCLEIAGIEREGVAHCALSDALAATDLLRFIAEGK